MGDDGGGHWLVRTVGVSASVNLPLHHKVQKFSSVTDSPGWSRKNGRETVVAACGYVRQNVSFSFPLSPTPDPVRE